MGQRNGVGDKGDTSIMERTQHSTSTGLMHGAQCLRLKRSSGETLGGTLVLDGDMVCIVDVDVQCMMHPSGYTVSGE